MIYPSISLSANSEKLFFRGYADLLTCLYRVPFLRGQMFEVRFWSRPPQWEPLFYVILSVQSKHFRKRHCDFLVVTFTGPLAYGCPDVSNSLRGQIFALKAWRGKVLTYATVDLFDKKDKKGTLKIKLK